MNKVKTFVKKYWVTVLIFAGMVGLYYYSTEFGNANPFLFPKVSSIAKVYESDKHLMGQNLWASFKMMIPAVFLSLAIALSLGTFLGLNKKAREALHPVIYTFSVVPAILLSPFVLLIAPNMFVASIVLIVYSTVWATLFATILFIFNSLYVIFLFQNHMKLLLQNIYLIHLYNPILANQYCLLNIHIYLHTLYHLLPIYKYCYL